MASKDTSNDTVIEDVLFALFVFHYILEMFLNVYFTTLKPKQYIMHPSRSCLDHFHEDETKAKVEPSIGRNFPFDHIISSQNAGCPTSIGQLLESSSI